MTDRELEELTVEECLALAGTQRVGRLAVTPDASAPLVVPVNFVLAGSAVVFRSDPGRKLDELAHHLASFEVDHIDPLHHTGWSVLFRGEARRVTDRDQLGADPDPWTGGGQERMILVPVSITGRRIRFEQLDVDPRGYR